MGRGPAMVLAAVATMLLAAGCGSSGNGMASSSVVPTLAKVTGLEKTTLNVAVVPAMDSAGFFVAMHDGLFAQEGLTIHYSPAISSDSVIAGQVAGKYDITAGNYVSYIQAEEKGSANLRIIAEGSIMQQGAQVILTLPKYHINTLQQLEGHYLAVNAPGNIDQLLAQATFADQGIPQNSVHFSAGIPFPFMQTALQDGSYTPPGSHTALPVQAVVVPEPFSSLITMNTGAVTIADLNQGATAQFPIEGYVTTSAWARANPNTLQAFLTALRAGQQIADSNRSQVEQAFESLPSQEGQVPPQIAAMMALDTYPLTLDTTRLQRVADIMKQFGLADRAFNMGIMTGLVDRSSQH
jgi:NitT/TauT family transport system substrate-binding protein